MTNITFRADSYPAKIYALGQVIFESKTNSEIADLVGCSNEGQIANARKSVADKTGWRLLGRESNSTATPRARKSAGSLPAKIEGFLVGMVDEVPAVWEPSHVMPVIEADEVSWNRFIRRMSDLDEAMVESFERWLDHPATMSRMTEFMAAKESVKQWDNKAKAEALALELIALGYGDKTPTAIMRELWI